MPFNPSTPTDQRFQVRDRRIYNPQGNAVILRGVVLPYGYFFGSQGSTNPAFDKFGWGQLNLSTAKRDFAAARALGVNLVRVMVTYEAGASETGRAKLNQIVRLARREGLIVQITGGDRFHENAEIPVDSAPWWIAWLAAAWKDDPYVWISPVNEPNCDYQNHLCEDWENWQKEHQEYVRQIRAAGNTAPIVVNTIRWSWDLSQIAAYPLDDPLNNLIYGAHRYANCHTTWTEVDVRQTNLDWANLASDFAMIVDETGAYNGEQECGSSYHIAWNRGFLKYVAEWIAQRGGNGVTGFAWYWSDDNSLTGDWRAYGQNPLTPYGTSDAVLTEWGQVFRDLILTRFDDRRNLASEGQTFVWSYLHPTHILANTGSQPAPLLVDNDPVTQLALPAASRHAYQAAGVVWSTPQTITTVNFIHSCNNGLDGVFAGDLHLQFSSDGETWELANWTLLQQYPINAERAAGATFTFTGQPTNVRVVRVVGAVCLGENTSRFVALRELQVFGEFL